MDRRWGVAILDKVIRKGHTQKVMFGLSPEDGEGGARRISGGGGCRQNSEDKFLKKEQSRSGNWRTRKFRKVLVLIDWFGLLLCVVGQGDGKGWWRKTSSNLVSGVTLACAGRRPKAQRCGRRNQLGGCCSDSGEG